MRELVIKKCNKCGATIKVIKDCKCDECGIMCCGEVMKELKHNSVDASFEKHIPNYTVEGEMINVVVNHVMDEDHFIEWIGFVTKDREEFVYLKPGDKPQTKFKYEKGVIYSYSNKHYLWMTEVK